MSRKRIGCDFENSERINLSGFELDKLGVDLGGAVAVDFAEAKTIARAVIESTDAEDFFIVTSA